jgi:transposase-like protein
MAEDHRRLAEEVLQGALLDDPNFLKEIVERVLQEMLEAEMTQHIGAAPYESGAGPARGIATATSPEPCVPGWAR